MRRLSLIGLSLTCALGISGCKTGGGVAVSPPQCPTLAPAPAHLMQSPQTVKRVQAELFRPQQSAKPR